MVFTAVRVAERAETDNGRKIGSESWRHKGRHPDRIDSVRNQSTHLQADQGSSRNALRVRLASRRLPFRKGELMSVGRGNRVPMTAQTPIVLVDRRVARERWRSVGEIAVGVVRRILVWE